MAPDRNLQVAGEVVTLKFTFLKKSNQWAVIGPADEMKLGPVHVERTTGDFRTERIIKLTRAFEQDGEMVKLGFLALLPRGS
jgi:hypothetical protein